MKKKLRIVLLMIAVVAISALNLKYSLHIQKSIMELALSTSSWSEKFPEDPFEGEGPGCGSKNTKNSYEYAVQDELFELDGEKFYSVLKIPATEIICCGTGEVPCTFGLYFGEGDVEIMSEKELEELNISY